MGRPAINKETAETLKVGFIGAGAMATWSVLPALHFAPIELRAICDVDKGRAESAAVNFGARSCYTDYRKMWAEQDLDALIIQMHPGTRQSMVLEALDTGYHVFVPKPPAESLADAAANAGKVLMANFLSQVLTRCGFM
jgi:predicted dehydrogenase